MRHRVDRAKTIIMAAIAFAVIVCIVVICVEDRREPRFKVVEKYQDCRVLVDTETGVGYVEYKGSFTALYDADGNLYRPNGWRDY